MFLSSVQCEGFQTWAETAPSRVPRGEDDQADCPVSKSIMAKAHCKCYSHLKLSQSQELGSQGSSAPSLQLFKPASPKLLTRSCLLGLQESHNKGFGISLPSLLFLPFDYNLTITHVSLLHQLCPLLCRNDNLFMSLAFLHRSPVTSQEDRFQNKHRLVGSSLQSSPQNVAATGMSSERLAELPGQVHPQL